jgi:hypothetical protein
MDNPKARKQIWVEAAKHFIAIRLSVFGFNVVEKVSEEMLDFFASEARKRKTTRDRNEVWYEKLRDYIVKQMLLLGLAERKTYQGSTHYMLEPKTTMGKDKVGLAKFDKLVDLVGIVEAYKLVTVTIRHIPTHDVEVTVRDPRINKGVAQTVKEHVEAGSETEYTFINAGSTRELLFWTIVLGNQPTFQVGPAPKRVKEGKLRRKR